MDKVISFSEYKNRNQKKKVYHSAKTDDPDLSERIERIKSSIIRINQLMAELRTLGTKP